MALSYLDGLPALEYAFPGWTILTADEGIARLGTSLFSARCLEGCYGRMFETLSWFKQHFVAINRLSGSVLLVIGVFLVMGRWVQLVTPVMRWYADHLNIG